MRSTATLYEAVEGRVPYTREATIAFGQPTRLLYLILEAADGRRRSYAEIAGVVSGRSHGR